MSATLDQYIYLYTNLYNHVHYYLKAKNLPLYLDHLNYVDTIIKQYYHK